MAEHLTEKKGREDIFILAYHLKGIMAENASYGGQFTAMTAGEGGSGSPHSGSQVEIQN